MKYGTGKKYDTGVMYRQKVEIFTADTAPATLLYSGLFGVGYFGMGKFGSSDDSTDVTFSSPENPATVTFTVET